MERLFRLLNRAHKGHFLRLFWLPPTVAFLLPLQAAPQSPLPRPDHIVLVVEENHSFDEIIGNNKDAPYLNELLGHGATFTSFFALRHPSQSNYIQLFSGDRQGVNGDECLENQPLFAAHSLGGELIANGLSFKGYAESMPKPGSTACVAGSYARKHCPWISFADVPKLDSLAFSDFPSDFEKLPTVAMVIPDLRNDMHDGSISAGDMWLKNHLSAYVEWAKSHNSLLIITWDEDNKHCGFIFHTPCDTKPPSNRIPTIFSGPMVKQNMVSDKQYTHLDLLKTLEEMYGLPLLGGSQNAIAITDIWN